MLSDRVVALPKKEGAMEHPSDERFLRNIEGYLTELVLNVENIDEVSLIADVLVSVQAALRDLGQEPRSSLRTN